MWSARRAAAVAEAERQGAGLDARRGQRLGAHVEARFSVYAENRRAADAGGRYWFGQLLAQAYRHWMATGEILATLPLISRPGTQWRTKLRILPAWRMSDRTEGWDLKQGVRIDPFSAPRGYILKVKTLTAARSSRNSRRPTASAGRWWCTSSTASPTRCAASRRSSRC
jgi:hypothetical protein